MRETFLCMVESQGRMEVILYFVTHILDIAALLYLLWMLHSSTVFDIRRKKPLSAGIILTIIAILCETGTIYADNGSLFYRIINIMCNVIGFSITPIIPIVITLIFNKGIFNERKFWLFPTVMNVIITFLSPFFGFIFYIDTDNHYIRGDYYFIFVAVYIINFLILFLCTLETGKKYNYPIIRKSIALSLFTIIGTSIQLIFPSLYSTWHCVTLSLLLYYFLLSEFDNSFDTLTGLYNRASFEKAAKQIQDLKAFSVIVLDIDNFKNINDTFGHDYGDTIIKTMADIIQKSFAKHYTCYRCGGDEFFIISNETDQEKIEFQLKTMISNLNEMREQGNPLPTISYGYSIYKGKEKLDFQRILKEADDQMYQYKKTYK